MMTSISDDENSALLSPNTWQDGAPQIQRESKVTILQRLFVVLPYVVIFLTFEIALNLVDTPMSAIQEDIICRNHYPDATKADPICKNDNVQSELSIIKGWEITFGLLPGMISAVPYGMVAERCGRRIVLGLSLLGLTLSQAVVIIVCHFPEIFPLRLIWLGAALTLVGGGPLVTTAMLFVIASDISTEEQRSTTFFYLSAISLVGQLLAAPLTYAAMASGAWYSVYLGFGCLVASTLAIWMTSETLHLFHPNNRGRSPSSCEDTSPPAELRAHLVNSIRQAMTSIRVMFWDNKKVGVLLLTFLFTSIGKNLPLILMQYVTKQFQWTWAEAGLLNSISAAVRLLAVAVILPFASRVLLLYCKFDPPHKDLWLARAGIVALVVGAFGIGMANSSALTIISLIIYSFGFGYGSAMRGLMVAITEGESTSILFMIMSILESIGLLISGPCLATSFKMGMEWGRNWLGLPFFIVGSCFSFATIIIFVINIDGGKADQALDG